MNALDTLTELIERPRRAFVPFADLQVIDQPGWLQLICPSFRTGGLNEVSLATQVDDARIDAVLEQYQSLGLVHRWQLLPDCDPTLEARLTARGLKRTEIIAMAAPVMTVNTTVEVHEVTDAALFSRVSSEGWGGSSTAMTAYTEAALNDPQRRFRYFVSFVDGQPAGTASAVLFERSMYLMGGVVLERFRNRGAYGALLSARMNLARQLGIELVTSHSLAGTSAPILQRLGFTAHFTFASMGR